MGALFVKAVAKAARAFPEFNGFHVEGEFRASETIHVGVAIAIRGGGLAAPAIHDAADLALDELMRKMRDLVTRVRAGRFKSSEIADPTITVTSLGDRGVDAVWGVIYPPQVAIVGFGRTAIRPWIVDGAVLARPTVAVSSGRRSPRQRRPSRRALPREDRSVAGGAGRAVNDTQILAVLRDEIGRRAPEIDFDAADRNQPIQREFDIDSMDFLNLIIALHERLGVDIPESDYGKVASIAGALAYLLARPPTD